MYHFHGIDFGPTSVDVEADGLREAIDKMGHLYTLHKDALFLEAHVRFFYDVEPEVVPKSRDDAEGYVYRGFECLRTGCNVTFKEKDEAGGVFPGRFRAYINGEDRPKLYDPRHEPEEILSKLGPDTPYVRQFGVDIGESASSPSHSNGHQAPPPQQGAPGPQRRQAQSNGQSSEVPFDQLSPRRKVKRLESTLNQAPLARRPSLVADIATWKNEQPDEVRRRVDELINEYATEDAYDARMVEIDTELKEASEEGTDALREACFEVAKEISRWHPDYRESGRAIVTGHAPDDVDIESVVYQHADTATAQ